eukprot:TRINITY_DN12038_c0_g1_i1.p1 TRINITY_DN12038_c0_g1~~TRINITY_DN12038_c0_g1_i1.p1  ORF type:complete len:357 (+),score=62.94 TRINITY_DN12038_c0_g1_i1:388-1458(+)
MTRTGAKRRFEVANSVDWKEETLQKGDSVMVQAYNDIQPYIGQVQQITKQKDGHYLEVSWFYRPEEAIGGRRPFHGEKELFKSTHLQQISLDTVLGKCQVLSLEAYEGLSEVDDTVFFSRFTYHPVDHRFYPDQVYVYCECQFPYNPDKFMVQCDNCEDWFHPKCVDLSQAEVEELKNSNKKYICRNEKCQKTLAKRQKMDQGELMPGRTIQTTLQSTTENQSPISNQINNIVTQKNQMQNAEKQPQNGNQQNQNAPELQSEKVNDQTNGKNNIEQTVEKQIEKNLETEKNAEKNLKEDVDKNEEKITENQENQGDNKKVGEQNGLQEQVAEKNMEKNLEAVSQIAQESCNVIAKD